MKTNLHLFLLGILFFMGTSFFESFAKEEKRMISPSEAISQAQPGPGETVLSSELVKSGNQSYYLIKILSQGKVRTVKIHANSAH